VNEVLRVSNKTQQAQIRAMKIETMDDLAAQAKDECKWTHLMGTVLHHDRDTRVEIAEDIVQTMAAKAYRESIPTMPYVIPALTDVFPTNGHGVQPPSFNLPRGLVEAVAFSGMGNMLAVTASNSIFSGRQLNAMLYIYDIVDGRLKLRGVPKTIVAVGNMAFSLDERKLIMRELGSVQNYYVYYIASAKKVCVKDLSRESGGISFQSRIILNPVDNEQVLLYSRDWRDEGRVSRLNLTGRHGKSNAADMPFMPSFDTAFVDFLLGRDVLEIVFAPGGDALICPLKNSNTIMIVDYPSLNPRQEVSMKSRNLNYSFFLFTCHDGGKHIINCILHDVPIVYHFPSFEKKMRLAALPPTMLPLSYHMSDVSKDGRFVACLVRGQAGALILWSFETGHVLRSIPVDCSKDDAVCRPLFSGDGRSLRFLTYEGNFHYFERYPNEESLAVAAIRLAHRKSASNRNNNNNNNNNKKSTGTELALAIKK